MPAGEVDRMEASPAASAGIAELRPVDTFSPRFVWSLLLLSVVAVVVNLHPLQPFFDQQLMLGSGLAILALLQFGWWGLAVGIAAYSVTWTSWGHPFELINGSCWLVSLQLFLSRFRGEAAERARGRLVLATVTYWLLIGLPAEWLWFHFGMGLNELGALSLGLKELVTAVLSASLGLLLYQGLQLLDPRQRRRGLPIRGLTSSTLLLAITLPSLLMILLVSRQLNAQALKTHQNAMQSLGRAVARVRQLGTVPKQLAGVAVRVVGNGREQFNSDPTLFRQLSDGYRRAHRRSALLEGLVLLEPRRPFPVLEANRQAYWLTQLTNGPQQQITVVQPAAELIRAMDFDLLLPSFSLLALVLIGGTLISEAVGLLLDRQFSRILMVAQSESGGGEARCIRASIVRELNNLETAIQLTISQLEANKSRYRSFFNLPIVGTAITSVSRGWVEVNEETCRILGYSREELFRLTWAELTHPDDLAADNEQFQRMLRREIDGYELEKRFIRQDGTIVHTLLAGGCGPIGNQPVELCYVNLIDITARKQLEAELTAVNHRLQALATTDGLTGIWNRRQMEAFVLQAITRSDRYGEPLALILADIDNFKTINDRLGHSVGDQVLIEFCRRIQPYLRSRDGFCRWGGEEFLILLDHTDSPEARALAEKLRQLIAGSPFPQVGTVTASFGVAQRREQEDAADWMQRVDHHLYAAKEGGRNRVIGD